MLQEHYEEKIKRLEAACAEMREAIFSIPCPNCDPQPRWGATTQDPMPKPCGYCPVCKAKKTLFSSDAGKGFLDHLKVRDDALRAARDFLNLIVPSNVPGGFWEQYDQLRGRTMKAIKAALDL